VFQIVWSDTSKKLNPDICGNMTEAIIHADRNLKCSCCKRDNQKNIQINTDGNNID